MTFKAGAGKAEITPECVGVGLMGWGDASHRAQGTKTPLHARAVCVEDGGGGRMVFVCADLCFITEALREEVLARLAKDHPRLGLATGGIILTATHTHCAPGGHSRYLLYNIMVPGFQPQVFDAYARGIVRSVAAAVHALEPAVVRFGSGCFPENSKVAFNRSPQAWSRNPEARPGQEIDREMTLLRFDTPRGRPLGLINWFPVHATSVHRDYPWIHADNKGAAAELLEREMRMAGHDGFVAVFAQGAAGDVTPNFVRYADSLDVRGMYRDDERSCEFNAGLQAEMARRIFSELGSRAGGTPLEGRIQGLLERHDFSNVEVAPEFASNRIRARTGPAAIGCNFLRGTDEGRGAPAFLVYLARALSRAQRYVRYLALGRRRSRVAPPWKPDPVQGPKVVFMESGRGRLFGFSGLADLFIPDWFHPAIRQLKQVARECAQSRMPFTPQKLPLQIVRLGPLALVAVPAEFTTVAGKRLCKTLREELGLSPGERVILCGYANAYSGYVTTFEEYQTQAYEGASTHFGQWTLAAYQTLLKKMAKRALRQWEGEGAEREPHEAKGPAEKRAAAHAPRREHPLELGDP